MKRFRFALPLLSLAAMSWSTFAPQASAQSVTSPTDARQIVLLPPVGNAPADLEIANWQKRLADKPTESAYWERLGWAYIAKARLTQDAGYYKLAELTATAWETACGPSPEERLLRGHVAHNLHRFKEAEAIARGLVAERKTPADYALLSDSLMEQGRLDEAVEACQTLSNMRPGVEAFTRIAHLRLLFGDLNGAIAAMESAIRAGDPRDGEGRAWMYSRLAGYQLLKDNPTQALIYANTALSGAPQHPLALAVKGRALYSKGEYEGALDAFRLAAELNPIPDNQWWLADLLRNRGQVATAEEVEKKIRRQGPATDPRTTALFLDTRGEKLDQAEHLASEELKNRADVFTHDAAAFAYLRAGQKADAAAEMKLALARHTSDPRIALHAGLVATASGDRVDAARCFARARSMSALLTPSERSLLAQQNQFPVAATP